MVPLWGGMNMKLALIGVVMGCNVTNLTSLKHNGCLIDTLGWIKSLKILEYFIGIFSNFTLQLDANTMLEIKAFTCDTYISYY
jgi:uncharacterized membrane protein